MKKYLALLLALVMVFAVACPTAFADDDYTIRIYSNSNSTERTTWLINEAKKAGFDISIDDNSVISGDTAAVQAANENKDGDLIFGLNETRWGQLIDGNYENLSLVDWTPSWADKVGAYKYDGKAYGLVIQNVLMLYRNDEFGTNGEELHFDHWADVVDSGYTWYRQNKIGGTTNMNINSAILYAFTDPESPAGGISIDGWKALWKFCADGKFGGDDYKYGFDPLNKGDVAISEFYSSALYGKIDAAAEGSEHPLVGAACLTRPAAPTRRPRRSRSSATGSAPPRCRLPGPRSSTPFPATPTRSSWSTATTSPPSTCSTTSPSRPSKAPR